MDTIELDPRLRHAAGYLGRTPRMLIGGEMVGAASGKTFGVYNPATGAVIANAPEGDKQMSISPSPPRLRRRKLGQGEPVREGPHAVEARGADRA
jgi:hypothetical protein